MGDHKERTGRSKVGMFLSKLGEKAAPLAKMGLSIAAGVTGIKQLEDLAHSIRTSNHLDEEERATALDLLKLDLEEAKEITKRWQADMNSDSKLAKNIRPYTLISLLSFLFLFMMLDGLNIGFILKDIWIDLLEKLTVLVFLAYFGSRGWEKIKNK